MLLMTACISGHHTSRFCSHTYLLMLKANLYHFATIRLQPLIQQKGGHYELVIDKIAVQQLKYKYFHTIFLQVQDTNSKTETQRHNSRNP